MDSEGVAEAINAASNNLKARGYIYMGVATPTTTPDVSGGKVFYLAAQAGSYPNFDTTIASDMLTSLAWNGERWIAVRIADLVTAKEVEQAILDNTAKKIEKGEAKPVASEVVAEALEARDKQLENKADKTEYYPEMAVGIADNLRGRGEAKEETYTYRPSAGASNSITDEGIATVKRLKGNTIVYNQLAYNGDFKLGTSEWVSSTLSNTMTIENGNLIITTADATVAGNILQYRTIKKGVYAICAKWRVISEGYEAVMASGFFSSPTVFFPRITVKHNEWNVQNIIITATQDYSMFSVGPYFYAASVGSVKLPAGAKIEFEYVNAVNLTQMFGAGNEPTTVKEFKALFPNDYYDYDSGELCYMNVEGIITNGFNQFNGEYAEVLTNYTYYLGGQYASIGFAKELGGALEEIVIPEDKLYTPKNKGYIYATGSNICINLSHSGVNNGNYEPYNERRRELSEVAQYFPEGMRSAGSVYDEINETEAIQRVAAVDLGSLVWGKYIDNVFYADIPDMQIAVLTKIGNIITPIFTTVSLYELLNGSKPDNSISVHNDLRRIYVRSSSYNDADSFAAAMQGVMLNYALKEFITKPIPTKDINLNYAVWDWGTEKAVSSKLSAPFRADIVYGFNAVDTIRTNKLDIEALMQRVAELEAKIAETSTTTMEEEIL